MEWVTFVCILIGVEAKSEDFEWPFESHKISTLRIQRRTHLLLLSKACSLLSVSLACVSGQVTQTSILPGTVILTLKRHRAKLDGRLLHKGTMGEGVQDWHIETQSKVGCGNACL